MALQAHNPTQAYNPACGSASAVAKLYDQDLYAWAITNAQLLREKRFDQLDTTNLIEEIEGMARSERRSILSHLKILLMHLLKCQFQPQFQDKSSCTSIITARFAIEDLVEESPSLRSTPKENLAKVYAKARVLASEETGLHLTTLPAVCPYAIEQVLDEDWLPA